MSERCGVKISGEPSVVLKNCVVRYYSEYGIQIGQEQKASINKVFFIGDKLSILKDPLLWVALKILDYKYRKMVKKNG